ncbi:hypothetical protein ACFQ0B_57985 [Nonomuraea thailandensis]
MHPAEDLDGIIAQFDTYAVPVRERLGSDVLGLGLWLAAPVAEVLAADPGLRAKLRGELTARGLEVVTLNGFPYRSFHDPVVKHAVYRPDWTTRERLSYTFDLARILADLLPDDAARGSVSTLPLGWRDPGTPPWPTRRPAASTSSPPGWPPSSRRPGGWCGWRSSPSRAASWRRPGTRSPTWPAPTPGGSASAWTWPTWPARGSSPPSR